MDVAGPRTRPRTRSPAVPGRHVLRGDAAFIAPSCVWSAGCTCTSVRSHMPQGPRPSSSRPRLPGQGRRGLPQPHQRMRVYPTGRLKLDCRTVACLHWRHLPSTTRARCMDGRVSPATTHRLLRRLLLRRRHSGLAAPLVENRPPLHARHGSCLAFPQRHAAARLLPLAWPAGMTLVHATLHGSPC